MRKQKESLNLCFRYPPQGEVVEKYSNFAIVV